MSARNGIVLLLALSALAFLVACGGSGSPKVVPPPSGGFSPSNLNGTYVFSSAGFNVDGYFMTITGTMVANGNKGITGGAVDVVTSDPAFGVSANQAISSSSSYVLGVDGRGQANLVTSTPAGTILLDFVLTSSSHGLVTEFDGNGSGSGTLDLQTATTQGQLAGSYTFNISGTGLGLSAASFATIGSMTLGPAGFVTSGFQDFNNGGGATLDAPIGASSFVTVGTSPAPGTSQFFTSLGTYAFDVYPIDSTHLKFIETDGQLILAGDAYTQGTALPASGTVAFTMSGGDSLGAPLGLGGLIPLDASSNVAAGGFEDFNDGGVVGQDTGFTGGFSPLTAGRSVLTLNTFVNTAANQVAQTYQFAAYPFSSNGATGVQLLEIDNLGVTAGVAYLQSATTLAASAGYGLNLSAINLGSGSGEFEEDDIAEFTATSSAFTGIVDINDEGNAAAKQGLTGSYSAGGTGSYIATTNFFNFNLYVVNSSTFLLLETDGGQIGTGVVELQNTPTSAAAQVGVPMLRPAVGAHPSLRGK